MGSLKRRHHKKKKKKKDVIMSWVNISSGSAADDPNITGLLMGDKNSYICAAVTSWISDSVSKDYVTARWAPVTWLHQQHATYLIYFFAAVLCDILLCLTISRIALRQVSRSPWPDPLVRTPPSTPGHDRLGSCQMGKSSMEISAR